jgi:hypothetical protein
VVKLARALGVTCEAFAGCEDMQDREEPAPATRPGKKAPADQGGTKKGKGKIR